MHPRCIHLLVAAALALAASPAARSAGSIDAGEAGGTGWMPFDTGMDGSVNSVAVLHGQLYAGGGFHMASGAVVDRIARWNGSTWEALPGGGADGGIRTIIAFRDWLVVAGSFDTVGGVAAEGLAKWDGSQWSALPGNLFLSVDALAVHGNQLVVAGTSLATGAMEHIARWDGANWSALGGGLDDGVDGLGVHGGMLYAGAMLEWPASGDAIWRWDGTTWSVFEDQLDERVYAFGTHEGQLVAAGRFQSIGGVAANSIARWNGTTWVPLGAGLGNGLGNQRVEALCQYDGALWAAGFFESAGGMPAHHVARWDDSGWSPMGSGADWSTSQCGAWGGSVVVAGGFEAIDGVEVNYIARWQADPVFGNGFD